MKVYCFDCGHPTEYIGKLPNFCQKCGKNLSVSNDKKIPEEAQDAKVDNLEEEIDEYTSLPEIDALEVDIRVDKPRSFTFGEIFKESADDIKPNGKEKK